MEGFKMTIINNHVKLGALAVATNPSKIVSTGEDTAKVDGQFAQNFFKAMQLDYGRYVHGSNGSDFAVSVIDKEMEVLEKSLTEGLPQYMSSVARTMLGMLEAIKAGDTDNNGAVSATEMNALLAKGGGNLNIVI